MWKYLTFSCVAISLIAAAPVAAVDVSGNDSPAKISRCLGSADGDSRLAANERCRDGRYCPVGTHCVCDSQGCYCVYDPPWK